MLGGNRGVIHDLSCAYRTNVERRPRRRANGSDLLPSKEGAAGGVGAMKNGEAKAGMAKVKDRHRRRKRAAADENAFWKGWKGLSTKQKLRSRRNKSPS